MSQVILWYQKNKLSVNVKKLKFMLMGTQQSIVPMENVQINVGSNALKRVTSYKYLGVKLDTNLKFD